LFIHGVRDAGLAVGVPPFNAIHGFLHSGFLRGFRG
jgi:hypothetical protein